MTSATQPVPRGPRASRERTGGVAAAATRRGRRASEPLSAQVLRPGGDAFLMIFQAEPLARLQLIKEGVPPQFVDRLAEQMRMPKERLLPALGLSAATVNRKKSEAKALSPQESERLIGMARLVGQVQAMVQESGEPAGFHAAQWVARWLEEPLPALGGERPADFMDTAEGQAMVSNLLERIQSGAYA